jgi:transcriptional antiterminator
MISFNYWLLKDCEGSDEYFFDTFEEFENFVNYIFEFTTKSKKVYVMMDIYDEEVRSATLTNDIHKHLPAEFARLESLGDFLNYAIFEFENKEIADDFINDL